MSVLLLSLSLMVTAQRADADLQYAPPDPVLPIPLYSTRPEIGGLVLCGTIGTSSCLGWGWRLQDGSTLLQGCSQGLGPGLILTAPCYESDCQRWSLLAGSQIGATYELYLGHGFSLECIGSMPARLGRVTIRWYPMEGLSLSLGCDPFLRGWGLGWMLSL
jgi:hypothetical protein